MRELAGVPFYCIRAVTDTADESFANDFNAARDGDGHFIRSQICGGARCCGRLRDSRNWSGCANRCVTRPSRWEIFLPTADSELARNVLPDNDAGRGLPGIAVR